MEVFGWLVAPLREDVSEFEVVELVSGRVDERLQEAVSPLSVE